MCVQFVFCVGANVWITVVLIVYYHMFVAVVVMYTICFVGSLYGCFTHVADKNLDHAFLSYIKGMCKEIGVLLK